MFICQKDGGPLQNPNDNPTACGVSVEAKYNQLVVNIMKLADINELPVCMDVDTLKGGIDFGKNLFEQNAVYHKKCKKKFDSDKVKRAENRCADQRSTDIVNTNSQPVRK